MERTPSTAASGMLASSRARTMSLAMSTGRRCIESSHAPAGRPMRAKARVEDADTSPTSNGVASRVSTASSGMATPLTWVPSWLVV